MFFDTLPKNPLMYVILIEILSCCKNNRYVGSKKPSLINDGKLLKEIQGGLFQVQIAVSVTQEPVVVLQRMGINGFPVFAQEGRNQQQESALWLMEVGQHPVGHGKFVTRYNYYFRGSSEMIGLPAFHERKNGMKGLFRCCIRRVLVWLPL